MPKKKLSKAQVKRRINAIIESLRILALDKFTHLAKSDVPMSFKKMNDMRNSLAASFNRMK